MAPCIMHELLHVFRAPYIVAPVRARDILLELWHGVRAPLLKHCRFFAGCGDTDGSHVTKQRSRRLRTAVGVQRGVGGAGGAAEAARAARRAGGDQAAVAGETAALARCGFLAACPTTLCLGWSNRNAACLSRTMIARCLQRRVDSWSFVGAGRGHCAVDFGFRCVLFPAAAAISGQGPTYKAAWCRRQLMRQLMQRTSWPAPICRGYLRSVLRVRLLRLADVSARRPVQPGPWWRELSPLQHDSRCRA